MAEDAVICAKGLGKKYAIGHKVERERYAALRDVLVRGVRNTWRKTADMVQGRAIVAGDTTEEFWALKDVNFEVERGEVLGIIGRNGAGKTTLLKILSRITEPTEGTVAVRGRVASLLEVGTGFHPELTGRENIYLNGAILGMRRTEMRRKFEEIVAFAEVDRFLDTPVKRYSSGMYVRLAFAVAAHLEPQILVVDEVLAVGDAEFQKKCLGKMSEVAGHGRTVLFVSHNLAAVRSLCRRGILLDSGALKCEAPIDELLENYLSTEHSSKTRHWVRSFSLNPQGIGFESLTVSFIEGPSPKLSCVIQIGVQSKHSMSLLAVDVTNAFGAPIMQAMPCYSPFIPGLPGRYELILEVLLPPLIPGTYWLNFWMGPHNIECYDTVKNALAFEVVNSPTPGRTFPHTLDHGHIVPPSSCTLTHARHSEVVT